MTHPRKTLRDAVVARLKGPADSATAAGARVYGNRATQLDGTKLPAILVYTMDESGEVYQESPRELERTLTVAIEIAVNWSTEEGVDDELDRVAAEVEALIHADELFRDSNGVPQCGDTVYKRTEVTVVDDGRLPIAAARISYDMTYYTDAHADESLLDDLTKVHTEWEQPPAEGGEADPDAEDDNTLPT